MGEVFTAIARGVDQRCVVKTIRTDLHGEAEFVGRFTDEAKIMVRMNHPNIIRVFDCGKFKHDYYIAMEYVHGRDLGDLLDRAYEQVEVLPVSVGLYIAEQIAHGLAHVHGLTDEHGRHMGLVHRDVSPQNVMIGFDGRVRLIDFGLARTDLLPNRTRGALAVGKFGYMSPEQARHQPLDGRADIYAAGVTLFEVFTGERLVDELDQKTLWQRVLSPQHRTPRSVRPSLPGLVDELIMTAVAVDAERRFPTAEAMADFARSVQPSADPQRELAAAMRKFFPAVSPEPPPVPTLTTAVPAETSLIIATSREKQRSVFGRGDLPVEGTLQFDVASLPLSPSSDETWSEPSLPGEATDPGSGPTHAGSGPTHAGSGPTDAGSGPTDATWVDPRPRAIRNPSEADTVIRPAVSPRTAPAEGPVPESPTDPVVAPGARSAPTVRAADPTPVRVGPSRRAIRERVAPRPRTPSAPPPAPAADRKNVVGAVLLGVIIGFAVIYLLA
jgi:serine/threonine-protein kinase